ncbi:MAG TPA: hypothetical protein VG733_04110 [Chthoniobacteraceae bacterium]|nr:hypothetical protein [Chthoniobacteraceae bacterium]
MNEFFTLQEISQSQRTSLWLKLVAASPFVLVLFFLISLAAITPRSAGTFDRPLMDSIVAQVRAQNFTGVQLFHLDKAGKIHLVKEGVLGKQVWAERAQDGTLKVSIDMVVVNHGVTYGFGYSDTPITGEKTRGFLHSDTLRLDLPDEWYARPKDKIDEHWWRIYNPDM